MRVALIFALSIGSLCAQLRLDYDFSAAPERLSVLTINDLGFQEALGQFMKSPQAADLASILPVVLRIKNVGPNKIGYLNVRYTYTLPDGDHPGDVTYARNPILGDQFSPGEQILVYPGVGMFSHNRTAADPNMIRQTADLLQKCSAVRVSIDAVTFEDGEIRGADRAGIGRRYSAQRLAIAHAYASATGPWVWQNAVNEDYSGTRTRVRGYSVQALKEMLDKFAPLKGGNLE